MTTLLIVRFWYTLAALMIGVVAVTLVLILGREQHRRLAVSYAGFLTSIWIILLSFAIAGFASLLVGEETWRVPAMVVNGVGSLAYMVAAPFFYHAVLGLPIGPRFSMLYRFVGGLLLAGVALMFIPSIQSGAIVALNALLFATILYGIVLIALGYRRIVERTLRRAIVVFIVLATIFFPLMFLESVPWLGDRPLEDVTNFALPTFYVFLAALSIPFGFRRLSRPAYLVDGVVTQHFATEFGLSERETEVVNRLCAGLSNRQIAEVLFISPKTVENHLQNVFTKAGVHSRTQLITLLYANR